MCGVFAFYSIKNLFEPRHRIRVWNCICNSDFWIVEIINSNSFPFQMTLRLLSVPLFCVVVWGGGGGGRGAWLFYFSSVFSVGIFYYYYFFAFHAKLVAWIFFVTLLVMYLDYLIILNNIVKALLKS